MEHPLGIDLLGPMPSSGCEHVHSEEERTQIGLTIGQTMPYLPAHMNDTSNWYFPLHFRAIGDPRPLQSDHGASGLDPYEDPNIPWTWKGVQHLSETHFEPFCLPLPSLKLPLDWIRHCNPRDDIIASAHGLLLLKLETRKVSEMDALRRCLNNDSSDLTRWCHPKFLSIQEAGAPSEHWTPLMVYNPLRKEWRILPAVSPKEVGMSYWDYHYARAHLVVDEVENSYKVILVFLQSMCVYNSMEKTWVCHRFEAVIPWGSGYRGLEGVQPVAWRYQGASTCVNGRLLHVDLEIGFEMMEPHIDGDLIELCGHFNVFEVDEESGYVWQIALLSIFRYFIEDGDDDLDDDLDEVGHQNGDWDEDWIEDWDEDEVKDETMDPRRNCGFGRCSYSFEVVECMGRLFTIIPALLVQNWSIRDPRNNLVCMPLQFHILKLLWDEEAPKRGVLRIQIPRRQGFIKCKCDGQHPHQTSALWCRHEILYHDAMKSHKSRLNKNWFRCTAKGSVIWVSVHDYMLQYDVVSRESKTEIVPDLFGRNERFYGAVCEYKPSFHMKP